VPDAVLVTSSFLPGRGGIESHLAGLCAALRPRLAVLAPAARDGQGLPADLGYPVHAAAGTMLAPTPAVARAIEAVAGEHGTDRVLWGTPWPLALLGPALADRGLRYAAIVHGAETILPGAVPLLRDRLAAALGRADLLLPVSEYTAAGVRALLESTGHRIPEIALLRPRVDLERFAPGARRPGLRARLGVNERAAIVLCLGRLVPRKGVDRLVRAAPALRRRVPRATVVVAGTGPQERRLRRLALRIGAPVVFAGRVRDEDAPALYADADVFALPVADRWGGLEVEGLGVVLLEAAACEVPCVTGRSGGTPEAVLDGATGFVVNAREPDMLVEATARLLVDRDLARRMGRAGRRHVAATFGGPPPGELLDWLA
jgi:phosphatidylinositol alpha-1,6-mannosyltransferase